MTHPSIHRLQQGYRFCSHCQELAIEPEAKSFCTMCKDCYFTLKDMSYEKKYEKGYCTDCSSVLPKEEIESCRKLGRRLDTCPHCHSDRMAEKPSEKRLALISSLQ